MNKLSSDICSEGREDRYMGYQKEECLQETFCLVILIFYSIFLNFEWLKLDFEVQKTSFYENK